MPCVLPCAGMINTHLFSSFTSPSSPPYTTSHPYSQLNGNNEGDGIIAGWGGGSRGSWSHLRHLCCSRGCQGNNGMDISSLSSPSSSSSSLHHPLMCFNQDRTYQGGRQEDINVRRCKVQWCGFLFLTLLLRFFSSSLFYFLTFV